MLRRRITTLLLFEVLAILALHSLGSMPGFGIRWADMFAPTTRVDDTVASALRYVTLALAYWLLLSTVLYLSARLGNIPKMVQAVRWATFPAIRRIVDRALAVGLTVGTLIAPAQAIAQTPPPPVEQTYVPAPAGLPGEVVVVVDEEIIIPPGALVPQLTPLPPPTAQPAERVDLEAIAALPTYLLFERDSTHAVKSGENLWSIAADRLRETTGIEPSDTAMVAYWVELIAANQDTLNSGDPDLIYPGEVLVLPPVAP